MSENEKDRPMVVPVLTNEQGQLVVCCEECESTNIDMEAWDFDERLDCGHRRQF